MLFYSFWAALRAQKTEKIVVRVQLRVPPAQGNAWVPQNHPAFPHFLPGNYSTQECSKHQANLISFLKNTVLPTGVTQRTTSFTYLT